MNTNNTSLRTPGAVARRSLPPLVWGVGGVMATAIVALAGTVAYQRSELHAAATPEATPAVAAAELPASAAQVAQPEAAVPPPPVAEEPAKPAAKAVVPVSKSKHTEAAAGHGNTTAKTRADGSDVPPPPISGGNGPVSVADAGRTVPPPPVSAAPQVCNTCGTVESVEPYQVEGQGSGAGAIAGGAVGAMVGNQFGKGGGRTAARLLGAVGGALIGNQVEKHAKSQTLYRVRVKMDDGSRRTFTEQHPVDVGAAVTVQGEHLQHRSKSSSSSGSTANSDASQGFNADGR